MRKTTLKPMQNNVDSGKSDEGSVAFRQLFRSLEVHPNLSQGQDS